MSVANEWRAVISRIQVSECEVLRNKTPMQVEMNNFLVGS